MASSGSGNFKTYAVVNPQSANGATGKTWPKISWQIEKAIGKFEFAFTQHPRHAAELTTKAIENGAEMVVSIGGDGTHNEVVNGFFREDGSAVNPNAVMGIISRGTGGDLIKSLEIPKDIDKCIQILVGKNTRTIDVGRIELDAPPSQPSVCYFANITDFGLGGVVVDKVNHASKALGGKVSFYIGTVRGMMAYKNKIMRVDLDDGKEVIEGVFSNVVVANGRFFGGGMKIAPRAELDDGLFDVVFLGDLTLRESLSLTRAIYSGTAEKNPKIFSRRAKKIHATSPQRVLVDMDGEQPGRLPITLEVLPQALRIKTRG